jgi:hypothetical protein
MKNVPKRICVTTKDIANIKGCSDRQARQIKSDIKAYFNKEERHHFVTFKEFSDYTKIPLEDIEAFILD